MNAVQCVYIPSLLDNDGAFGWHSILEVMTKILLQKIKYILNGFVFILGSIMCKIAVR